ncbi:hypothetical protein R75461_07836 [Paraburkholderia nemoris]|uniref:hypothetical protein n=1 Tax=Paraburkholderia nemoris TaxID=2793076 RepID=UPI00190A435E|nr:MULTISPECIES: hypothetical protein [Paraburkholderia]MBK3786582.1 hypothetical protein [Paraburkholderia aspalathi]CAE6858192.1 hypothetical protein R75461_07836 [Paraburkholderia nemoris]
MQLDLFANSQDVMLRNDVLDALQRRHAPDARQAWEQLTRECPGDDTVPGLAVLIAALEDVSTARFVDHASLAAACRVLSEEISPAARRLFGEQAAVAWMASCWRALAQRAVALPFDAGYSDHHAAPMWLEAGEWVAAKQAVERIASWRRIPAPLAWITEARYRADGLDAAWPLLAELAWLAPARCVALLTRIGDASLDALRRQFDAQFVGTGEITDFDWFPAWLLTVKPGLAARLRGARLSRHIDPERATSMLWQILSLERQGRQHDLVERRKALRDLHAGLYAAYMKTR